MVISSAILLIIFIGVFTQTVSGFGLGLVAMPMLIAAIGLDNARPFIVLIAVTIQIIMMIKLRQSLTIGAVGIMSIMGLIGIPIGSQLTELTWLSEKFLLTLVATIVLSYALYSLLSPTLPELKTDRWLSAFGFISGILTGAYNMGGPPVVIYGNARRWSPEQLRSNLQGISFFKTSVLLTDHILRGHFTVPLLAGYAKASPVIFIALTLGFVFAGRINVERFRQIILILLVVIGAKILFNLYI